MGFAEQSRAAAHAAVYRASVHRAANPGFAGTLSPEQRSRMLAVLSPSARASYDAMTPAQKTVYESDFADTHWDVISGTSTTAAQAAQTQSYLGATEHALDLTFGSISTALANNNQQRIAEISGANAAELARIQAELEVSLAPTRRRELEQQVVAMQHTQDLLDAQRNQSSQMFSYIAVAAVLLVGGGLYVWSQQARKNPVVVRSGHKMFIPMALLPDYEKARERAKRARHRR